MKDITGLPRPNSTLLDYPLLWLQTQQYYPAPELLFLVSITRCQCVHALCRRGSAAFVTGRQQSPWESPMDSSRSPHSLPCCNITAATVLLAQWIAGDWLGLFLPTSPQFLNTSRNGDSTTSLGSCASLLFLRGNFFLISNLNLP